LSNLKDHALREFKAAGWTDESGKFNDEMQEMICNHVLKLIDLFSEEGHSGSTAPYAINLFRRLAMFEPVSPLTGEDDEWIKHDYGDTPTYQNKRMGSVFKQADRFNGQAYWLDGKVFWEWASAPDIDDGKPFKSYFTSRDSMVTIEFPWTKPEKPEYVFTPTEQYPNEVLA
jgi:hypothetical protein